MSAVYFSEPALIANRIILWRDVMRAELDYPTSSLGPLFICRQSIDQHSHSYPLTISDQMLIITKPNQKYIIASIPRHKAIS